MSEEFLNSIGDELVYSDGNRTVKTADVLSGKTTIMIYFSAHWCPPCQRFTPALIKFYNKLKAKHNFELIFVSFDKSEDQFKEYTSNMPWPCLPFDSDDAKATLARKYDAGGIPHLVVLDENGEVITKEGVDGVSVDEEGEKFPWKPKGLSELWPEKYLTKSGLEDSSTLNDKYLMLYFSAHWCPPCRGFTPTLSKAYTKLKEEKDDFELVFVSSDKDKESFDEYFGEMTFCALPFEEREAKAGISKKFEVRGIPSLLILGPVPADGGERPLINKNLRGIIEAGDFSDFPFHPKPYGGLDEIGGDINETKCLVVFHENGDDDEQKEVMNVIKTVSAQCSQKMPDTKFLWSMNPSGLGPRVRDAAKLPQMSDDPSMIILDIPDEGGYYVSEETDITVENVVKFLENPGDRKQL
uniref:Thioredoxin domain-containing protein n=1 Tax=Helicotheca tamesis TaxID=374047 RepID=A0A7S2MU64_9STRA|mmetsp:Transcript_356/g.423  ORF Transcript_356/g.423 Transcript_356/m.423 type:complete len:412 (+) Transcript_356:87-1322(+)